MRICIFGAGAVGSHFAVRLALAGHDVCCVMRGPHLEAVKAKGLTLRVGDAEFSARVKASDDPAAFAPPDLAFLDPGGGLRAAVSRDRIIGGVIFSSNEVLEPGIVENLSPDRNMLLVGECDDRASERVERLRAALNQASIQSPPVTRIREAIWSKLMTNMSMSVLCLITGQTAKAARAEPTLRDVVPRLLEEAQAIGQSCCPGVQRVTRTGPAPDHKPSLLQDF